MFSTRHLSTWLLAWSAAYFASNGRVPSPFAMNAVAMVLVVIGQASIDLDWRRFLFAVLTHVFPLILTLPPRMTAHDGLANLAAIVVYCVFICVVGDNVTDIYDQYRKDILACH